MKNRYSVITYNDGDNRTTKADQVSKILADYSPDIFGLQETQEIHLPVYQGNLPEYEYVYFDNDGTTYNSQPIFYKKDKFKLLDCGIKWLSDTPHKQFSKYHESAYIRSCTFALLMDIKSENVLLAVNTHIDYTAIGNEKQVKRIIELIREDHPDTPVFIIGDFNMRRESKGYKILEEAGFIATEEMVEGAKKDGTCVGEDKTIDFCFVDKRYMRGVAYHVINDHELSRTASDHYAVYTEIELTV